MYILESDRPAGADAHFVLGSRPVAQSPALGQEALPSYRQSRALISIHYYSLRMPSGKKAGQGRMPALLGPWQKPLPMAPPSYPPPRVIINILINI